MQERNDRNGNFERDDRRGAPRDDARRRGRQPNPTRNERDRGFHPRGDDDRYGPRFEPRYDEIDPMRFGDDDAFSPDRQREPLFDGDRNRGDFSSYGSDRQRRDELERDPYRYGETEWRERYPRDPWQQPLYAGGDRQHGGRRQPAYGQPTDYGSQDLAHHGVGAGGLHPGPGSPQQGPGGRQSDGSRGTAGGGQGRHAGKGPKGYQRSDERVIDDVCQALERDPDVDASEIEVSCQKGEIVLKGSVESREAKRRAEECVEDLPGVKDVRNELRVQPPGSQQSAASGFQDRSSGAARNPS